MLQVKERIFPGQSTVPIAKLLPLPDLPASSLTSADLTPTDLTAQPQAPSVIKTSNPKKQQKHLQKQL